MAEERRQLAASGGTRFDDFATSSDSMRAIHETVLRVAATTSPVLIQGEVGVGKERLARAIHAASARSDAPFVVADCTAISEARTELDSSAPSSGGTRSNENHPDSLFRAADGGTLFFDDLAELSPVAQSTLFRTLQDAQMGALGGGSENGRGVRVISASTLDLEAEVDLKRFRGDLYYLLSIIALRVPPLRERLEDLPGIVRGILLRQTQGRSARLTSEALALIRSQAWRGNVRELESVLERSVALADGDVLGPAQILVESSGVADTTEQLREVARWMARAAEYDLPLRSIEDLYIEQVLLRTGGNKARAARILQVNRTTLYRR